MSKKNRFKKHKSRRYRKLYHLSGIQNREQDVLKPEAEPQEIKEDVNPVRPPARQCQALAGGSVSYGVKTEEMVPPEDPRTHKASRGKFKPKTPIKNWQEKTESKIIASDLKKTLTLSLSFAILITVLYFIKIKTSVFDLSVDYLYKIFFFS